MIGMAAGTLLLFNGDILGASGILSSVALSPKKALQDPSQHWKLVLIASFLSTTSLFFASSYDKDDVSKSRLSPLGFVIAGLLVGFGTKLGNGCTSGHGICGLPRISRRSMVSVATFMLTGVTTAMLTSPTSENVKDFASFLRTDTPTASASSGGIYLTLFSVASALMAPLFHSEKRNENDNAKLAPAAVAGAIFSAGLYVGKMVYASCVLNFLDLSKMLDGTWDPTLCLVMGGGSVVSWISYQFVQGYSFFKKNKTLQKPIACKAGSKFGVPTNTVINAPLVLGAVVFGMGWGLAGICPGPGLWVAGAGVSPVLSHWLPAFLVGSYAANQVQKRL